MESRQVFSWASALNQQTLWKPPWSALRALRVGTLLQISQPQVTSSTAVRRALRSGMLVERWFQTQPRVDDGNAALDAATPACNAWNTKL
jgi:hypothetical protein